MTTMILRFSNYFQMKEVTECIFSTLKSCSDPYLIVHQQALKCFGILIMKIKLVLPRTKDKSKYYERPANSRCFVQEFQEEYLSKVVLICDNQIKNKSHITSIADKGLQKLHQFKSIILSLSQDFPFTW